MGYKKSDVTFHSDRFGPGHAAVNVKTNPYIGSTPGPDEAKWHTGDWCIDHYSDDQINGAWEAACEWGWETAEAVAQEIFGKTRQFVPADRWSVQSEGRSGGWLIVTLDKRPMFDEEAVEHWDAIDLARWVKFEKWCRGDAENITQEIVDGLYLNAYPHIDHQCGNRDCPCAILMPPVRPQRQSVFA